MLEIDNYIINRRKKDFRREQKFFWRALKRLANFSWLKIKILFRNVRYTK